MKKVECIEAVNAEELEEMKVDEKPSKREKWFEIIAYLLLSVVLIAYLFFVHNVVVSGQSMEPTFQSGDFLLASKSNENLDYEDVVTIDGEGLDKPLLKRIIGLPGDTIEIKDSEVYRNGTRLEESYVLESMQVAEPLTITLSENEVWAMGDNRNNSLDSRVLGAIPVSYVQGEIIWEFPHFHMY